MLYERIGRQVHRYRIRNGLTQMQLAEAVGISQSFLGHIERGTRKMSIDTLCSLAAVLNCSVDDLLETGLQSTESMTASDLLRRVINLLEDEA